MSYAIYTMRTLKAMPPETARRIATSVALKVAAIDAVTDTLNTKNIGGVPLDVGEDRFFLIKDLDRDKRFQRLSDDYVYLDKLTDAVIKVMPNDEVSIYNQETGNVNNVSVQWCHNQIGSPDLENYGS